MSAADPIGDLGGAVLPHLPNDHGVGVGRPDGLMELADEVVGQLVGHVQPPAVRPGLQPAAHNAVFPPDDIVPVGVLPFVDGGQGIDAPPGVEPVGPVLEVEPGVIGTLPGLGRPRLGVEAVAVEIAADKAGVVEHTVQNDPHPPGVGSLAQSGKIRVTAQHGVYVLIIGGAVAVVFRRLENGVEIQGLHAQGLEVGQLLQHALQVSAEEVPVAHLAPGVGAVFRLLLPGGMDAPAAHHAAGVGDAAAAEAVGKDLITGPLSKPGGHLLAAVIHRQLVFPQRPGPAVQPLQAEGVEDQTHIIPRGQGAREHVPFAVPAAPGQKDAHQLIGPAFKPGGEHRPGKSLSALQPEREMHHGSGADRPVGRFIPLVPGIEEKGIRHPIIPCQRRSVFSGSTDSRVSSALK